MRMWNYKKVNKQKKVIDELEIVKGNHADYEKLKKFHYINRTIPSAKKIIYALKHKNILYGVIVYSPPSLELIARNRTHIGKAMKKGYPIKVDRYKFLNRNFIYISRIIIHPSLRGIGAANYLIENTWRLMGKRFVEGMGAMLWYRNFFPKSYSYYMKVEIQLDDNSFFVQRAKQPKGTSIKRLKTPVQKYGYVLYINDKIKPKY